MGHTWKAAAHGQRGLLKVARIDLRPIYLKVNPDAAKAAGISARQLRKSLNKAVEEGVIELFSWEGGRADFVRTDRFEPWLHTRFKLRTIQVK